MANFREFFEKNTIFNEHPVYTSDNAHLKASQSDLDLGKICELSAHRSQNQLHITGVGKVLSGFIFERFALMTG